MDEKTKKSLLTLGWSVLITLINGLITIFNPATKEVAMLFVDKFIC